jgi:hypothetical protein
MPFCRRTFAPPEPNANGHVKRPAAALLVGLLLTVAGFLVALLVVVIALMVAAQILPDHSAPMTP